MKRLVLPLLAVAISATSCFAGSQVSKYDGSTYVNFENWVVRDLVKSDTHPRMVMLSLLPDNAQESINGHPVTMVVTCLNNRTDVFIQWSELFEKETARVEAKIGKVSSSMNWNVSADRETTYSTNPQQFLQYLEKAPTATFQTTLSNGVTRKASYTLDGVQKALQTLREVCPQ